VFLNPIYFYVLSDSQFLLTTPLNDLRYFSLELHDDNMRLMIPKSLERTGIALFYGSSVIRCVQE